MNNGIFKIQPCHERWDKMLPDEKGRHCAKCDKVVCDATQLDDQQLMKLINESEKQVCLRIQENRAQKVFRSKFHRWKYAIMVVILSWFFDSKKAIAQVLEEKEAPHQPTDSIPAVLKKVTLKGVVNDSTNKKLTPIESAMITLKYNGKSLGGTFSNEKGEFCKSIEENFVNGDSIEITVKYLFHNDLKQIVVFNDKKRDFYLRLNFDESTKEQIYLLGMIPSFIEIIEPQKIDKKFLEIHHPSNTTTFSSKEIERGNFGR
jgi:hypothetical protein